MAYAPASPVYKRRRKQEDWVILGRVDQMHEGELPVTLNGGRIKTVLIKGLGRPFDVEGVQCQYGYLSDPDERTPATQQEGHGSQPAEQKGQGKEASADADDFLPDGHWGEDFQDSNY